MASCEGDHFNSNPLVMVLIGDNECKRPEVASESVSCFRRGLSLDTAQGEVRGDTAGAWRKNVNQ
jgi:hypothetical protein